MDEDAPAPRWVDWEEPEPPPTRRRAPWLLGAAVVPWAVVALLLLRADTTGGSGGVTAAGDPSAAAATPVAPDGPDAPTAGAATGGAPADGAVQAPAGDGPPAQVLASGARTAASDDEARAVATVVARAWLGGIGPRLDLGLGTAPPDDVYVEHLVVEAVDHPGPGAAVVTVLAVVLHADGDVYERAALRRLAVPLHFDAAGARPAGPPYELPAVAPDPVPLPLAGTPVTDTELLVAAGEALTEAGYAEVDVTTLARTGAWPLVVTATARAPGADATASHVLWLREHLGRLVVAGTRPPTAATGRAPAEAPATEPATEEEPS